jgi:hypothetical protein
VKKFFCQYCVTTTNEIDKPNEDLNKYCLKLSDNHKEFPFTDVKWECMHHAFITDSLIDQLWEELTEQYPPEDADTRKSR